MKNQVQDGKVLTFLDSQLTKPSTRVAAGDPVLVGTLVGVAFNTTTAAGDKVDVASEGVFNLSVLAKHAGAVNDAVAVGDQLYIDASTAVVSKDATDVPFGVALGAVTSGATVFSLATSRFSPLASRWRETSTASCVATTTRSSTPSRATNA